jgi:hypothetical protein
MSTAVADQNESMAISLQATAQTAKNTIDGLDFQTPLDNIAAKLVLVQAIKDAADAATAQAIADYQASAHTSATNATNSANDANASAEQALASAQALGVIADGNSDADGYLSEAQTAATDAATAAATAAQADANASAATTEADAQAAAQVAENAAITAQDAAENAQISADNAATALADAQGTVLRVTELASTLYTVNFEDDGVRHEEIALSNGSVTFTSFELNENGVFASSSGDDDDLVWKNGAWETDVQNTTYTEDATTGVLTLADGFQIKLMSVLDLDGNGTDYTAMVNNIIPGDINVTFSSGDKAYFLGFKEAEGYKLWWAPTDCSDWNSTTNTCNVTPEAYTSFESYMISTNAPVWVETPTGGEGIYFEREIANTSWCESTENTLIDTNGTVFSSVIAGMAGNLVTFDRDNNCTQTVVGTWSAENIPNSSELVIQFAPTSGNENLFEEENLIALANGTIYKGKYNDGSGDFRVNDKELFLNESAFNAVAATIKANVLAQPTAGDAVRSALSGNTFYTTIFDGNVTFESWEFNADATVATWVELEGGDCNGTDSIVIDDETGFVTFTPQTDSCGLDDTNSSSMHILDTLSDYMLLDNEQRLYGSEAKARDYFSSVTATSEGFTVEMLTAGPLYMVESVVADKTSFVSDINFSADGNVTVVKGSDSETLQYEVIDGNVSFSDASILVRTNQGVVNSVASADVYEDGSVVSTLVIFSDSAARDAYFNDLTAPQASYELSTESVELAVDGSGVGTWTWTDLNTSEANVDNVLIADNMLIMQNDARDANITNAIYLGDVNGSDVNSSIFSTGVLHQVAYIRLVAEEESWGEVVKAWDTNDTYSSFEAMIDANTTFGGDSPLPDGQGYAFNPYTADSNGTIRIIDYSDGSTVTDNVGTYEYDATKLVVTLPADATTGRHRAFYIDDTTAEVVYGDYAEAGSGGIAYFLDANAKAELTTYFENNADSLTDEISFHEEKFVDWSTDFSTLANDASDITTFPTTVYEVEIEKNYQ